MTARSITVVGGNLYQIAAVQLGDATQAVRIAQLNGITDYFLNGVTTLLLPAADTGAGGGVPPQ